MRKIKFSDFFWLFFWLFVLAGAAQCFTSWLNFPTWAAVIAGVVAVFVAIILLLYLTRLLVTIFSRLKKKKDD